MSVFSVGGNLGFALGPMITVTIVTQLGFEVLPVMAIFSLLFLSLFWFQYSAIHRAKRERLPAQEQAAAAGRNAYLPLFLTIGTVVMRSWTQMGLMTYIPFLNYLKGPLVLRETVSTFLLEAGRDIVSSIWPTVW
jgi:FSR family fosmidomycin resistance protein-like MFS transporter